MLAACSLAEIASLGNHPGNRGHNHTCPVSLNFQITSSQTIPCAQRRVSILGLLRKVVKALLLIFAVIVIFGNLGFDLTQLWL